MCAKKSSHKPARTSGLAQAFSSNRASVSSSSALYRVLRGGRQRPQRSVDRKTTGRNASEAIEPRQISRVCVLSQYCNGEGNIANPRIGEHSGVRVHGMRSRLVRELGRSPTVSHRGPGRCKSEELKYLPEQYGEVRCFRSSDEVRQCS
jgi:hypothetical protein